MALCGKGSNDPFEEDASAWPDVAFFLTGLFVSSGFGLSGVLVQANVIVWQTLVMSIAGSIVLAAAVVVMVKFVLGGSSDSEMQSW